MHDAAVGARIGEAFEQDGRVVDHQMAVEEELGALAERPHDHRTDGEVGDEVAVHHVDVEQVGRVGDAIHLGRELSEVGRQDRRRQFHWLYGTPRFMGA